MTVPRPRLHAFIDEAGQRSPTTSSSDHFIMAAVVIPDEWMADAGELLAQLRLDLGRKPDHVLHFTKFTHTHKIHACAALAKAMPNIRITSVVVCKRHLGSGLGLSDDEAYLYTFRYLLERLSWMGRDAGREMTYTLAHVRRFKMATLRSYEARLRAVETQIAWGSLDPKGGRLDQPSTLERLQLADTAASAIFKAFEPDDLGYIERRYLDELKPCLWRRKAAPLTSYGLKLHPWSGSTKAAYPWVAAL